MKLDRRVQVLGRLVGRMSIGSMDDARLRKMQTRSLGHNSVTDFLFGKVAPQVRLTEGTASGAEGSVPVRIYRPTSTEGRLPLIVNFHGGGWALGNLDGSDWLCSHVSAAVHAVVVSVDYRLAPTHPWPAAVEDCYAALADLVDRADELGVDAARTAVMGDSAGGNLAAVVCLLARDRSGPPLLHQGLLYPATDLTWSSPSVDENAHAPILTKEDLFAFRALYLGQTDPRTPLVSPVFADDLTGLPPALVQVAEHDPIRDDGIRYASALEAAGVPTRLTTYAGMPHGYFSFPWFCRAAPQALSELCAEQERALSVR